MQTQLLTHSSWRTANIKAVVILALEIFQERVFFVQGLLWLFDTHAENWMRLEPRRSSLMRVKGSKAEMPRWCQLKSIWRAGQRLSGGRFYWERTQLRSWELQSLLIPGLQQRPLQQLVPPSFFVSSPLVLVKLLLQVMQQFLEEGAPPVQVVSQAFLGLILKWGPSLGLAGSFSLCSCCCRLFSRSVASWPRTLLWAAPWLDASAPLPAAAPSAPPAQPPGLGITGSPRPSASAAVFMVDTEKQRPPGRWRYAVPTA